MLWLSVLALALVLVAAITLPRLAWRLTRRQEPDEERERPETDKIERPETDRMHRK